MVSVPARVGAEWRFDADVQLIGESQRRDAGAVRAWRGARRRVAPRVGERWRWLVRLSRAPSHAISAVSTSSALAFATGCT